MFSIKGDVVLDPFAGTGTTLVAALASRRNSLGIEIDNTLIPVARTFLEATPRIAGEYNRRRLVRHQDWVRMRTAEHGPLKYANRHYGFPVMTAQEQDLLLDDITGIGIVPGTDGVTAWAQYGGETRSDEMPAIKPGNAHRLMDVATKPPVIKQNTQVRLQL